MNLSLTPSQLHTQTLARTFARAEVAPLAREADETGIFPLHLVQRMGELHFFNQTNLC